MFHNKYKKIVISVGVLILFYCHLLVSLFGLQFFYSLNRVVQINSIIFFESRLVACGLLILIYVYVIKIEKLPFLLWSEKKYSFLYYIVLIVATLLSCFIASIIAGGIVKVSGHFIISDKYIQIVHILKTNTPLLLFAALTAGITEELTFRGYLLPRLEMLFNNKYLAIIISSLLFGLAHLNYGTVANVAGPFVIGLLFAFHYQKYKNIKMLIICHFLYDLIVMVIAVKFYNF